MLGCSKCSSLTEIVHKDHRALYFAGYCAYILSVTSRNGSNQQMTTRQLFPAILVRIGTPILETEEWALLSKNTDEIVTRALKRQIVEQFAKEHGYRVTNVINDYN